MSFDKKRVSKEPSFLAEFWSFIREEKKWWLVPLLLSLGLIAGLSVVALSPAAPFIYTLF